MEGLRPPYPPSGFPAAQRVRVGLGGERDKRAAGMEEINSIYSAFPIETPILVQHGAAHHAQATNKIIPKIRAKAINTRCQAAIANQMMDFGRTALWGRCV